MLWFPFSRYRCWQRWGTGPARSRCSGCGSYRPGAVLPSRISHCSHSVKNMPPQASLRTAGVLCCRLPSLHNLPAPDSKIEFPHWPHTPSSGSTMYPSSTTWIFFFPLKNLLLIIIRVYHAVRMWASLCDGVHGAFLPLWDRTWVTRLVRQACLPSRLSGKQALVLFFQWSTKMQS